MADANDALFEIRVNATSFNSSMSIEGFERALALHDAGVAAKALDEFADRIARNTSEQRASHAREVAREYRKSAEEI